jgi:hypothetical protein
LKTFKTLLFVLFLGATVTSETGCFKKGADDPFISLRTRKSRVTNDWVLHEYKKNGTDQDLSGTYNEWNIHDNGAIDQTEQGTLFGFTARETHTGTWSFLDNGKTLSVSNNGKTTQYTIDRLSHTDLWLIRTDGSDSYTLYFSPR